MPNFASLNHEGIPRVLSDCQLGWNFCAKQFVVVKMKTNKIIFLISCKFWVLSSVFFVFNPSLRSFTQRFCVMAKLWQSRHCEALLMDLCVSKAEAISLIRRRFVNGRKKLQAPTTPVKKMFKKSCLKMFRDEGDICFN